MSANRKVNWEKRDKVWTKSYQGKRYYLGTGRGSSDRESYNLAVRRFEEIKKRVNAGQVVTSSKVIPVPQKLQKKRKSTRKKRKWNPKRVKSLISKFLKDKMQTATSSNGADLSFGRVQQLKNRLQHFLDYFGDTLLTKITASDITKWSKLNAKRVEKGEISPSTLRQDYVAVKQLFKYAYKQELINNVPRNLDDLGKMTKSQRKKQGKSKRWKFFTKKEIQLLYESCNRDSMHSRWFNRGDTEIETLQLAIVIGINTGMTQQDLCDLEVGDLFLNKRPPRVIRQRSKTGIDSNHLLWKKSVDGLKEMCKGKRMNEKVFTRRDGRPMVTHSPKGFRNRSDVLGASFKRLVQRVFGDDDTRAFQSLRNTGADLCKQRMLGTEDLYLAHAEGKMSAVYTRVAQRQFDLMLTFLEKDLGFIDKLQKLPKGKTK
jgi:integrase